MNKIASIAFFVYGTVMTSIVITIAKKLEMITADTYLINFLLGLCVGSVCVYIWTSNND